MKIRMLLQKIFHPIIILPHLAKTHFQECSIFFTPFRPAELPETYRQKWLPTAGSHSWNFVKTNSKFLWNWGHWTILYKWRYINLYIYSFLFYLNRKWTINTHKLHFFCEKKKIHNINLNSAFIYKM